MAAINWACVVILAGVALACWVSKHLPPRPGRTAAQVRADVAKLRSERDRDTCEAIWQLTDIPSPRKETGQ
jgi:hypothetical protein